MTFLSVRVKRLKISEELLVLDIDPKEMEYHWVDQCIRSEEVKEFYELTQEKTVVNFYEGRPLIIKESYSSFLLRIKDLDYDVMEEETEE